MNTLSNIDIINIINKYNLSYCFGGVFSKDKLPLLKPNTFYIINLEDHDKGPGTHWTAFYYNTLKSIYFDPFGFVAPLDVQNKIKPYIYNDDEIQNIDTSSCGFYCIAFIKFLHDKANKYNAFNSFVHIFKLDTLKNEKVLYNILYNN
jgi:hypothetical protein